MARYYVNTNAQSTGEHEVHREGCSFLPLKENRVYLGEYKSCAPAVKEAAKRYQKVDGCFYCCWECHTR